MKVPVFTCLFAIAGLLTAGCSGDRKRGEDRSPTSPTEMFNPRSGTTIEVRCPEFGESFRCNAFGVFDGGTFQDVTGLATWSTSDQAIATINSTGVVTAYRTGEVGVRAAFQGGAGFRLVWVVPDQGIHGTSRILAGVVLSLNGALPGVVMQIVNGPNAGRTATTTSDGRFFMTDLREGQFTIRLSKPGYVTAEYVWTIPGGSERITTLTAVPG